MDKFAKPPFAKPPFRLSPFHGFFGEQSSSEIPGKILQILYDEKRRRMLSNFPGQHLHHTLAAALNNPKGAKIEKFQDFPTGLEFSSEIEHFKRATKPLIFMGNSE